MTGTQLTLTPESDWRKLSPSARLASLSTIYLFPQQVARSLEGLEYLFHSNGNALLTGPRSVGKTALLKHFLKLHPPVSDTGVDNVSVRIDKQPVVITTPTRSSDARGLAEAILGDGGWPQSLGRFGGKFPEIQVDMFLRKSGTRVLFINRANSLAEGRNAIPFHCQSMLENMLDRAAASLVLVGDDDLRDLIDNCKELKDRFDLRYELQSIPFGPGWDAVLASLDSKLPFERTDICVDDMPMRLHVAAEGAMPKLMRLTRNAGTIALYAKKSKELKREHFLAAFSQMNKSNRINPFGKVDPSLAAVSGNVDSVAPSAHEQMLRINNRSLNK